MRHKYQQELGFNAERFHPLQDTQASTEAEDDVVKVRTSPKAEPLKEVSLPYSPMPQPRHS